MSPVIGFDYCPDHLQTPRGLQHAHERITSGALFTLVDFENEIKRRTAPMEKDHHTSALEKMDAVLTEVLEFTERSKRQLDELGEENWRYQDRTLSEQLRSEVTIYERALDRASKVLASVSKMALQEKLVSLGRAQVEMTIDILMSTLAELNLTEAEFNKARAVLYAQFQSKANLSAGVDDMAQKQLTSVDAEVAA
jgi:proline racemase